MRKEMEEMNKAIKCLAIELPEAVWLDVNQRWIKLQASIYEQPSPPMRQDDVVKLKEYFEQQLRLQGERKFKYNGSEAYIDAIDVCKNILKNKSTSSQPPMRLREVIEEQAVKDLCSQIWSMWNPYNSELTEEGTKKLLDHEKAFQSFWEANKHKL